MNTFNYIHADLPRQPPTAQQDASADLIRTLRAFQSACSVVSISPQEVGVIADHIEALAALVDREREAGYQLFDHLREMDLLLRAERGTEDTDLKH